MLLSLKSTTRYRVRLIYTLLEPTIWCRERRQVINDVGRINCLSPSHLLFVILAESILQILILVIAVSEEIAP